MQGSGEGAWKVGALFYGCLRSEIFEAAPGDSFSLLFPLS